MNATILKGSFTLGAADFSRKVLLTATVIVCARFLPPSTFGEYIFLLSFYQIFSVLGGAGLPNSLVRAVARSGLRGIRSGFASVLARLAYIVPTAAVMYLVVRLMGFSTRYFPALGLLSLMMLVRGAAENVMSIFQGAEDQLGCAKVGVSQSAVTLVATVVICLTSKDLLMLIGAHVLGGLASAVYGFALLRLKCHPALERGPTIFEETLRLLKDSHWLNAGAFVASAYNRVDVVLLRRLLTSEAVAVYGAPYRILDVTQIVPSSLVATILPSLCRNGNANSGIAHPKTAMRFLLLIAFFLIVTVTVGASRMAHLLFGPGYDSSIPVLQVLIWATIPMFWNFVLSSQLIALSFDRAILFAAGMALAVNVVSNLLLIPKFGYMACAVVTVATELALLGANLHFVSKIGATAIPEHFGRLLLATILIAGFCLCWCLAGTRYLFAEGPLLAIATLFLPVFRSDFSRSHLGVQAVPAGR